MEDKYTGKKIFFLHPHSVIDEIARELVKHEFETYLLYNEKTALEVLKMYDNSILFINIDEGLSEPEWEKFIRSIQGDPVLSKKVDIGIFTFKRKEELSQKYLIEIGIKCGYIQIDLHLKESLNILINILNANEAKGRRKYLRIKCEDNYIAFNIKINKGSNMTNLDYIKGDIVDISSYGMACKIDKSIAEVIPENTKFADIQLNLRGFNAKVSGSVVMKRDELIIFKFDQNININEKEKINLFVYRELQKYLEKDTGKLKVKN